MPKKLLHYINDYGEHVFWGISTTRNPIWKPNETSRHGYWGPIRVTLDGDKLSTKYKIVSYNDFWKFGDQSRKLKDAFYNQSEEKIITKADGIPNWSKYVISVEVLDSERELADAGFKNNFTARGLDKLLTKAGIPWKYVSKFSSTVREKIAAKYHVQAKLPQEQVWYHGRTTKSQEFSLKHTGKGHDEDGPGFYFTSSAEDAARYAYPAGIVMTVDLKPRKLVSTSKPPTLKEVEILMRKSPVLEDALTNWDENPARAFEIAKKAMLQQGSAKEVFEQIWFDFYNNYTEDFLKNLVIMGYDGHLVKKRTDPKHIVIYNPEVIKIVEVKNYE